MEAAEPVHLRFAEKRFFEGGDIMPVGGAVAAWAIGAGASAGVAAVAGAVAVGVVTGAVIGAATSLMSGGDLGDVFKGALKGAAIGGITAGIMSGAGIATGLASAESQLGAMGVSAAAPSAAPAGMMIEPMGPGSGSIAAGGGTSGAGGMSLNNLPSPTSLIPSKQEKPPMSDAKALLYSGLGQGVSQGVGSVAAAKADAESASELAGQAKIDREEEIAKNVPGKFTAQTANITMPNWWDKYTTGAANIEGYKPKAGLLGGTGVAA